MMPISSDTLMATGGGYMSMPYHNSEAVKASLNWPASTSNQVCRRQPHPPYATNYGHVGTRATSGAAIPMFNKRHLSATSISRPQSASTYLHQVTPVTRYAPYASRLNGSLFQPPECYSKLAAEATLPSYCALNDPHLREYYQRKFSQPLLTASASSVHGRQGRILRSGSAHSQLEGGKGTRGGSGATYKVAVMTGDKKNAGTDAKVFIRIKGSRGNLPKMQLTKKAGSANSKKPQPYKFNRGTTHIFKLQGKDIGEVHSVILEHDGLKKVQGWYVEQVEVLKKVKRSGQERSWLFVCRQWLSLFESDCQISRELFAKHYSKTEYEVVAVTGNMKGSGTDAKVSVIIFGKTGQTPKLRLKSNSKDCFERNRSDIFNLKTTCVGPMTKIRIMHDNTGFCPGWYLDRVVVTDLKNPKWKYYFPCGQWLAKNEGDGSICRDLLGSSDPLATRKSCKYKVTVYTGDRRGAGTDADVFVTLFGDLGDSGERRLDSSRNNFEKGQQDEFVLEMPSLGTLHRLRISHDNSGFGPGWFLDKIIVDDTSQNRVYEFPCNRWLAENEDDGSISRDLVCGAGAADAPPGLPYIIHVTTGDVEQAGTSARVFVTLHGGKDGNQTSGKIWLESGKFVRGRTDVFNVNVAEKLSPLSRIDIGHDNSGMGAGWNLDKVMVNCPSAGIEQWFQCGKWLATDEDEGLIERTLFEAKGMRKHRKKLVTWFVRVFTSTISGAGTDANVLLMAYGKTKDGECRRSDEVRLDNKGDNFENGQEDQFKIEMAEIGKPYKIRISHDNSGSFAGWHLDRVEMENMTTKKKYLFVCGRWLADDEEDHQIIREIPAEGESIKKPEPLVQYSVSVFTGKKRGAGTDADVFLEIFGEQGDTGERPLKESKTNMNKFERGKVDEFIIEAVNLKKIKKIRVGHDGKKPGAGWFLEKVVVRETDDSNSSVVFECNRWLDVNEDDGHTVREISAGGTQMLSTTSYQVSVKTGDIRLAGTDANVHIKIFGDKGDTGTLQLKNADSSKNKFERGRTDIFRLEASDIGKVERIRIGHDGTSAGSGWFLDEVRLDVPSKGQHYVFACHRWLDTREDDGKIEIEMEPTHTEQGAIKIPYEITVWTGDLRSAGTDANVFIQMYGENGKTEEYSLRNKTDNFETSEVDKFKIEAADIGPLQKIRVGHDGKGMFSGWFLDKILIQRHPVMGSKRKRRKKSASRSIRRGSSIPSDNDDRASLYDRSGSFRRQHSRYSNESDEYDESPRNRRRKTIASSQPSRRGSVSSNASDMRHDLSKRRQTSPFMRSMSRHSDDEWDSDDDQRKRSRKHSFLRKVDRESKDREEEEIEDYWFVCRRWFAKGEDDGKIVRELVPTDEHGQPIDTGLEEVSYKVTVYTGDVSGAGTDSNVYITMTGENGDTGERHLSESDNMNKFERNQEDIFAISAVHLGQLKKVKIRHDNKGIGAAWFLGHVDVEDTKTKQTYFLPCQRWLAVKEDDGQIARELVPVDKALKKKLSRKDSMAIRNEIALETAAAMTTYNVYVHTGDKFGAGTDADVFVQLFGEEDDTGHINLKSSKTHKNKFERNQMDEFVVQAVDIGEIQKLKIGHNNANGGGAWLLDKVEIDCPSLGKKWYFPCSRWLAKDEDDGQLERELFPSEGFTEDYAPFSPYEITVYTSDISGAGTDADVFIVLFGKDKSTSQKSLCANKQERKQYFERKCVDKFVLEMEDIGDTIEKIRIGHDGAGFGAGWHLDKIEVRRLKESGKGSETYIFNCNRWLAKNEDDAAIVRELVADKVRDESVRKDGSVKTREKERKDILIAKTYNVSVFTGDVQGGGTDANVFLTMFGDKGDSGERKLSKSETYRDKFEKGHEDKFVIEAVDLGNLYKVRIRHDNALLSPAWFLDRVKVRDSLTDDTYTFHCERWLGKNKADGKIDRVLYVKGYEGEMSSTSTVQSHRMVGSVASIDSMRSGDPFSRSPRVGRSQLEEIPEGPTIPYTVKVATGDEKDMGTESSVWIRIIGTKQKQTGKLPLDLAQRKKFEPSSIETFSVEAIDVKDVKKIELGIDSLSSDSGWFVKDVEVDMPTKGRHFYFSCKAWLARDKSDGKTSRVFTLNDGDTTTMVSYKPMVSYEVTVHTGDVHNAGTDSQIFIKAFGVNGCTSDIVLEKQSERFERGHSDLIKLQIEDIAPLKKLRIGHDGKGERKDWYLEKVEMRNMDTGDLTVFKADCWFSALKGDKKICRDIVAVVKGKAQLHVTTYKVYVKTSDLTGSATSANVFLIIFGENGDSDKLHLKDSETNKSPFKNNQMDVFTFSDVLSLGQLVKARVWHDNKGLGSAWHLAHVEVEDCGTGQKYMFPCNRWLSTSDDDNQVCRELSCANLSSPGTKEKIEYEIEVTTTDKKEAGMTHNAWLILEGDQKSSKVFLMENSAKNKKLRRGETDMFTMVTRNLGQLEKCILGGVKRDDKLLEDGSSHDMQWHCHQVVVTNKRSGDRFTFPCKAWIDIHHDVKQKYGKVLQVRDVQESKLTTFRNLGTVKYEVVVVTGNVRGAGTDANVCVILYGTHGDTGNRKLQQKFRDLFERNQTDKFVIEAIDLGDLVKLHIEHDNSGFGAGWLLDHVEVTNMATNQCWVFPCGQWFDKSKGDGAVSRELLPRD